MFSKTGVLMNSLIFTRKYALESLFNKVTGLMACNFIKKRDPNTGVFREYHKMFENSFFDGPLLVAASENGLRISKNF